MCRCVVKFPSPEKINMCPYYSIIFLLLQLILPHLLSTLNRIHAPTAVCFLLMKLLYKYFLPECFVLVSLGVSLCIPVTLPSSMLKYFR